MAAEESAFRGVLDFFVRLGIYDVLLPFLLVFTIMFAILEKSKVLGVDKAADGNTYPKRNLNSLAAFSIAFFVIASEKIVAVISMAMSQIVLLVLVGVSFLLLIGVFLGSEEVKFTKEDSLMIFFMIAMGIGVVLIFMNALGWLAPTWDYLRNHWSSNAVASIVLILVIIAFMFYVVKEPNKAPKKKKEE